MRISASLPEFVLEGSSEDVVHGIMDRRHVDVVSSASAGSLFAAIAFSDPVPREVRVLGAIV